MTAISEYRPATISSSPIEEQTSDGVINAFRTAFSMNLQTVPITPPTWANKTRDILNAKYSTLPQYAQRATHVFTNLGNTFPNCPTLEVMTRQLTRSAEFDREKLLSLFQRLQQKARIAGNAPIFQTAIILPAIVPLFYNLPSDEKDFWIQSASALPLLMVSSIGSRNIDLRNWSEKELQDFLDEKQIEYNNGNKDQYTMWHRAKGLQNARILAKGGNKNAERMLEEKDTWIVKKPK